MSFIYRPTPVITLSGKTVGTDHVPLRRLPAGTMQGYTPNRASPALNAIGRRTIGGNPWLLASGTMHGFLGQDDGSMPIDVTPIDTTMIPADAGGLIPPPDFPGFQPVLPINLGPVTPIDTSMIPAGSILTAPTFQPSAPALSLQPSAPQPPVAAAAVTGGASILTSIANFFKPTVKTTPMTAAQPGVYKATTVAPSWFGQSTLLPGIPNSYALIGGAVVVLLFAGVMMGGKK